MKTIAVFPNTDKIESAGVLKRIMDFFADKDVRICLGVSFTVQAGEIFLQGQELL